MLNTKLNAPEIWEDTLVGPPLTHKEQAYQVYVDKYFVYSGTKVPDEAAARWCVVYVRRCRDHDRG
ncbi:MAG: hypothetical protein R2867_15240 [Caldilineaceae bacterium]